MLSVPEIYGNTDVIDFSILFLLCTLQCTSYLCGQLFVLMCYYLNHLSLHFSDGNEKLNYEYSTNLSLYIQYSTIL